MHTPSELMCAVEVRQGVKNNARTAKALGTNTTSVDNWHRGINIPGDRFAGAIADVIGIDRQYVRACLALAKVGESEREHAMSTIDPKKHVNAIRIVDTLLREAAAPSASP